MPDARDKRMKTKMRSALRRSSSPSPLSGRGQGEGGLDETFFSCVCHGLTHGRTEARNGCGRYNTSVYLRPKTGGIAKKT